MSGRALFRVAIREEKDGFVRAYLAPLDSMKDATLLASVAIALVRMDEAVFDRFKELARAAAGALSVEGLGIAPSKIVERKPGEPL